MFRWLPHWIAYVMLLAAIIGLGFGYEEVAKLFGFSEMQIATAKELRQRLSGNIQKVIGNGNIATEKYESRIQDVKDKLIRVKVIRKNYEFKLQSKQAELTEIEKLQTTSERAKITYDTIQEIEKLLADVQNIEHKLETILKAMITHLDTVQLKIATLKTKLEMLKIQAEIREYAGLESDIKLNAGWIEQATADLNQTIYTLEAQQEIEQFLHQLELSK